MRECNYKKWHNIKKQVASKKKVPYFKERELWWCSVGLNIGYEQNGKNDNFERPVLILKKFNRYLFWSLPTTTKIKDDKHYFQFFRNGREYSIILSQIETMSSCRLLRKIGMMQQEDYLIVKSKLKEFLQ